VNNLREKALIVETKDEFAKVVIIRTSACDNCSTCSLGSKKKPHYVWAKNSLNAKVGQTVEIELEEAALLSATFIVYIIPLLAFLVGIFFGFKVVGEKSELIILFTGIVAMIISFLGIHLFNNMVAEKSNRYKSSIVRVCE
jgi:sigma-E factor negative regulatory protein RseC